MVRKAVFNSGDSYIDLIDLKSFAVKSIIKDEFWFRPNPAPFLT
jgi:hypothetical protein